MHSLYMNLQLERCSHFSHRQTKAKEAYISIFLRQNPQKFCLRRGQNPQILHSKTQFTHLLDYHDLGWSLYCIIHNTQDGLTVLFCINPARFAERARTHTHARAFLVDNL